jgi:hypothetical protein
MEDGGRLALCSSKADLVYSPDGSLVAALDSDCVVIYDSNTGCADAPPPRPCKQTTCLRKFINASKLRAVATDSILLSRCREGENRERRCPSCAIFATGHLCSHVGKAHGTVTAKRRQPQGLARVDRGIPQRIQPKALHQRCLAIHSLDRRRNACEHGHWKRRPSLQWSVSTHARAPHCV